MIYGMPHGSAPKVRPDVISARRENLTVLLDLETAQYYQLNEVGARIWAALCDRMSLEEIVAELTDCYDAPAATVATDVAQLIESLRDARLIECG